jgi:exodeoxyribonuclease III
MAYRKKAGFILTHKPDILIVPECEHPDKLKFDTDTPIPTDTLWYGTNQNKGLAVFSYGKYKFRLLDIHNPGLKTILPIAVTGGSPGFTLFAIWAYNPQDKDYIYVGQVWKAIHYYESILKGKNIILAGDFNSNVIWDKLHRKISHSMLVEKLTSLNIFSTYHAHLNLTQGVEEHPTYFMYRHQNRPYHIDYCFASGDLIDKLENVEVGTHEQWAQYSDHSPVIVSFKL